MNAFSHTSIFYEPVHRSTYLQHTEVYNSQLRWVSSNSYLLIENQLISLLKEVSGYH